MQLSSSSLLRAIVVAGMIAGVPGIGVAAAAAADAPAVTVAMSGGDTVTGRLEALEPTGVRLVTESGPQAIVLESIRRIDCRPSGPAAVAGVSVIGTDGARLSGTGVTWEGDAVRLETPEGAVMLPVARVQTIDWSRAGPQAGNDAESAWQQSLPDELESDVIVVAKGDETQCVPCAIVDITADAVRVVLDGETIPVKRDRVVGLQWLREPAVPGGVIVEVTGGVLPASRVAWSSEGLVIDDAVRLPAGCLRSVDYAAGRTTRLAGLAPERLDVEPFFGDLVALDGLAAAFRPRVIPSDDGSPRQDLMIRPRTVAVWRVPPGSRTFTTAISREASVGGGALVVIAVDDREVFRGSVDDGSAIGSAGIAIDEIQLDGARRLSITVDYGRAGPVGGVVILRDPLFTK